MRDMGKSTAAVNMECLIFSPTLLGSHIQVAVKVTERLISHCDSQQVKLMADSYLNMIRVVLESNTTDLQIFATNSVSGVVGGGGGGGGGAGGSGRAGGWGGAQWVWRTASHKVSLRGVCMCIVSTVLTISFTTDCSQAKQWKFAYVFCVYILCKVDSSMVT